MALYVSLQSYLLNIWSQLGQSNQIISFLSIYFYTFMRAGGNYSSLFKIMAFLRVWLPGTT